MDLFLFGRVSLAQSWAPKSPKETIESLWVFPIGCEFSQNLAPEAVSRVRDAFRQLKFDGALQVILVTRPARITEGRVSHDRTSASTKTVRSNEALNAGHPPGQRT